jgi:WhiB family redox-sensing transcriptional regulator
MSWRHQANCRNEATELFFPVGTSGVALLQAAEAKSVCRGCQVRSECRDAAEQAGIELGIFGGETAAERAARQPNPGYTPAA